MSRKKLAPRVRLLEASIPICSGLVLCGEAPFGQNSVVVFAFIGVVDKSIAAIVPLNREVPRTLAI
jgi:hypothetical protein